MGMRNLIIADRQDITNAGINHIIHSYKISDRREVFTADDKLSLIKLLSEHTDCVIILDYTLFDFSSFTELQILQERYP